MDVTYEQVGASLDHVKQLLRSETTVQGIEMPVAMLKATTKAIITKHHQLQVLDAKTTEMAKASDRETESCGVE